MMYILLLGKWANLIKFKMNTESDQDRLFILLNQRKSNHSKKDTKELACELDGKYVHQKQFIWTLPVSGQVELAKDEMVTSLIPEDLPLQSDVKIANLVT